MGPEPLHQGIGCGGRVIAVRAVRDQLKNVVTKVTILELCLEISRKA
jgi:hypothetical protein